MAGQQGPCCPLVVDAQLPRPAVDNVGLELGHRLYETSWSVPPCSITVASLWSIVGLVRQTMGRKALPHGA